jgi:hypothetical protein
MMFSAFPFGQRLPGSKSDAAFDSGTKLWQGARQFSGRWRARRLAEACNLLHIDPLIELKPRHFS